MTTLTTSKNKFHDHSESQFYPIWEHKKECPTWYFNLYFYEGPFLLIYNALSTSIFFKKKKPSASFEKHVYFGLACILNLLIGTVCVSLVLQCKTSENMKKETYKAVTY